MHRLATHSLGGRDDVEGDLTDIEDALEVTVLQRHALAGLLRVGPARQLVDLRDLRDRVADSVDDGGVPVEVQRVRFIATQPR